MSRETGLETDAPQDDGLIHVNGIDAATGKPLIPDLSTAEVAALAGGARLTSARWIGSRVWLSVRNAVGRLFVGGPNLGAPDDVDLTDPRSAGWAVVIASDAPPEARAAADRLFEHRRDQIGVPADRCKRFEYPAGRPLQGWLASIGAHASDVVPTRLPYYVTLVGGPEAIPFEAQSRLEAHYAVGRLAFDDPEGYGRYVASLIDYEWSAAVPTAREIAYWGTRNRGDIATGLSCDYLIRPLFGGIAASGDQPEERAIAGERGFRSLCLTGPEATRAGLVDLLHGRSGSGRPAVLFTASHGLGWRKPHPDQEARQGALLCQDWPGLGTPPRPEHYLAGTDIGDDARVHGLVAFLFACYGAGTPTTDHFPSTRASGPAELATRPFVAALPQRLLSHPAGGALAVIGHVELAWACSIRPPQLGASLHPFRNFLSKILRGWPVGHAIRDFGDRASDAASRLVDAFDAGARPDDAQLAATWIERNDARNYVLLGDPAARLRVEAMK
jgi:hypothetical protein